MINEVNANIVSKVMPEVDKLKAHLDQIKKQVVSDADKTDGIVIKKDADAKKKSAQEEKIGLDRLNIEDKEEALKSIQDQILEI